MSLGMAKSLESRFPSPESVAQWIVNEGFGESFIGKTNDMPNYEAV